MFLLLLLLSQHHNEKHINFLFVEKNITAVDVTQQIIYLSNVPDPCF